MCLDFNPVWSERQVAVEYEFKLESASRTVSSIDGETVSNGEKKQVNHPSSEYWRKSGDMQKRQYLDQLTGVTNAPFIFNNADWRNPFQLEAIVEHYVNRDKVNAEADWNSIQVDFLNPEGSSARIAGRAVTLDGTADLERVMAGLDTLSLVGSDQRFQIERVDAAQRQIVVSQAPPLDLDSAAWTIHLRPQIVLIDPFGARLHGESAYTVGASIIQLDPAVDLSRVNPYFDTIYLQSDAARSERTYRILEVDTLSQRVIVDGTPQFDDTSVWAIPSGVRGELPPLDYNLGPGSSAPDMLGWDHYDGALFIVADNRVHARFRWTSYTSRNHIHPHRFLSSLRGNRCYKITGCRAQTVKNINYGFCVYNTDPPDEPLEARYYFDPVVTPDLEIREPYTIPGKTDVMLHIGWSQSGQAASGDGTGSAGCLVSPDFYAMRDLLIALYQDEYRAVHGKIDVQIQQLYRLDHQASVDLWLNSSSGVNEEQPYLMSQAWDDRIQAALWLIRPDERPLG